MSPRTDTVTIAGVSIALESDIGLERFGDYGYYRQFYQRGDRRADCRMRIAFDRPGASGAARDTFDPMGNWELSSDGNRRFVRIGPPAPEGKWRDTAVFNRDYTGGVIHRNGTLTALGSFLDQFIIMNILSREEGFLLHAAGVILGGKGAVFAGASGAGKSTLYKLFARGGGAALLNDDRVALRKERGVWRVYGTPWHGECPQTSPAGAPLAGLFFLEQAKENRLRRLTPGEACARLLALALTPVWDKAATARVLGSFDAILEAIPSYEFGFLPDASAAELVSDGLAKGSFR